MTQSSMRERAAKVEYTCGCVFCDLGLTPEIHNGNPMHYRERCDDWMSCTKQRSIYRGVW